MSKEVEFFDVEVAIEEMRNFQKIKGVTSEKVQSLIREGRKVRNRECFFKLRCKLFDFSSKISTVRGRL